MKTAFKIWVTLLGIIVIIGFITLAFSQTPDDTLGDSGFFKLDKRFWMCSNYVLITKRHRVGTMEVNHNWEPICVEYTLMHSRR